MRKAVTLLAVLAACAIAHFPSRADVHAEKKRQAEIEEIIERDPYPDVEHQSRRAYIFARRPQNE